VLHVSDNGPGIPEELRDTLFDAFVTHGKKKGVGLGLAIAKSIVEAHSGTITFDTSMGQGTTFHVRLPVGV
jgi:signal transduction histidine kinase